MSECLCMTHCCVRVSVSCCANVVAYVQCFRGFVRLLCLCVSGRI